ncbi:hypothetical protein AMTR_s00018p00152330 [Amborella trichopoda]|uniref:Uncharacterized protein n=1 Tax=Amborella trichopoda TaxID=13333 RepID=W1PM20_AMBTC|nr:hypothetical protein AMTR_s00018p00152330 [Amborella trichopoda]
METNSPCAHAAGEGKVPSPPQEVTRPVLDGYGIGPDELVAMSRDHNLPALQARGEFIITGFRPKTRSKDIDCLSLDWGEIQASKVRERKVIVFKRIQERYERTGLACV